MGIFKVADGAYFVPSFSTQTITPGYDTATTIQSLGAGAYEVEVVHVNEVDAANTPSIGVRPDAPVPHSPQ